MLIERFQALVIGNTLIRTLQDVGLEIGTLFSLSGKLVSLKNKGIEKLSIADNGYITSNENGGEVTLSPNTTSTVVNNSNVTSNSSIVLFPTSANAAANFTDGNMYIAAKTPGSGFTITHTNDANTDKTFDYIIIN